MTWQEEARTLADSLEAITGVAPAESDLTDRLKEYRFEPTNGDAAGISLIVSAGEVIFGAGRGTRFELGAPNEETAEIERLARAVVSGRLSETVKPRSVRFVLALEDGTERSGKSSYLTGRLPEPHGVIEYGPYAPRP